MTDRFRAHIVVNVLCTVSLMSIFLTVIGTWIGSRGRRRGLIAQQVAPPAPECYTVLTLPITKGVVFVQKHLTVVHFSPTGGTRRAALLLVEGLAERIDELDLPLPAPTGRAFGPQDAVLFAGPVFGGRLPVLMTQRLKNCTGEGTPAVTAAVYGNRAFEDALLELNDCVTAQGFRVVASAALVAEHSISRAVAAGRPDGADREQLLGFAPAILRKLASGGDISVPGNRPYRAWTPSRAVPAVSETCTACGQCAAQCPARAISPDDPKHTDPERCFLCMRCIARCPQHARTYPAKAQAMVDQRLAPLRTVRRENELFV